MKKGFHILLFMMLNSWLFAQSQEFLELIECEKKRSFNKEAVSSSTVGKEYDVKYHRLYWKIDPAISFISGSVFTVFLVADSTSQIQFDLNDNMLIDSVIYHNQQLSYTHNNNVLDINLNLGLLPGSLDSILVYYRGAPAVSGFGSWSASNHASGPIISTLSEPYGARDWWPCKQSLDDKIDSIDIYVEVPNGNLAASNGVLLSSTPINLSHTLHHWSHRYPITCYLIAVSVTNYSEFTIKAPLSNGDTLDVLHYCYPQSLTDWQNKANNIKDMLVVFDSLFEIYPFHTEKYGHAQWERGGGMEHQTMSFMGNINIGLTAHELAHQWFGNKITCGSWEDIWLNEGFATYLTGLTFENGIGVGSNLWYNWRSGAINIITSQNDGSVKVDDTSSVSRIFDGRLSYNKGAYLLHMLRWKLGDEDFFQSIRNYLQDSILAFSYARTEDLKFHLEQQSTQNLDEFFNDWYYGQGYPSYDLFLEYDSLAQYELTVNQSQSHASVSFFEMPIEVKFYGHGKDSSIVFDHEFDGQKFDFSLPFEVISYEFDPELWICAKSSETLAIEEIDKSESIVIFPNPSKDYIYIEYSPGNNEIQSIALLDFSGKSVDFSIEEISTGKIQIYIPKVSSGLYFLKVKSGKELITARISVIN